MSTSIFEENWKPISIDEQQAQLEAETEGKYFINKSSSSVKPAKLARYSFKENLIDINDPDVLLGYEQTYDEPDENPSDNLTGYISVVPGETYEIKGGDYGVDALCYFNENKEYSVASVYSISRTNFTFIIPSGCYYLRITIVIQDWGKVSLTRPLAFDKFHKGIKPLNIINNKQGELIYKDLKLEVRVKQEAIVKDFVHNFNLNDFINYPISNSNLGFYIKTQSYYGSAYTWPARDVFLPNVYYNVGITIWDYVDEFNKEYYICSYPHTSAASWDGDVVIDGKTYKESSLWTKLDDKEALYITKPIKESNYQSSAGYPYLTELVFKNIWGCDMLNYLNTYVKVMNLAIFYDTFFAFNLRKKDLYYYSKYFEKGYFKSISEGGVRLFFGESFETDELLGKNKANNYFTAEELVHEVPENWDSSNDEVMQGVFGLSGLYPLYKPFDHFYTYTAKIGMPFFKEKVFNDSFIQLNLEKTDVLGNIYKRIVNLPILLTFTNNLIKIYYAGGAPSGKYAKEYLTSNDEHVYSVDLHDGTQEVAMISTIWCPNVARLSLSSTVVGEGEITEVPTLKNLRTDFGDTLNGQTCQLVWKFKRGHAMQYVGDYMRAVHILEYSDGSNYDKFIFIEKIVRSA